MKQRAVFIDRDGTLVHPRHYPSRPDQLRCFIYACESPCPLSSPATDFTYQPAAWAFNASGRFLAPHPQQ